MISDPKPPYSGPVKRMMQPRDASPETQAEIEKNYSSPGQDALDCLMEDEQGRDAEILRALVQHILDNHAMHATDLAEIKERIGLLEGSNASVSRRLDCLSGDIEKIKRRLQQSDVS